MLTLTQKENSLLQDEKKHEETCIQKYNEYANKATSPQLKALFQQLGQKEQEHLNTINQIISGTVPNINAQPQAQAQQQQPMQNSMSQNSENNNPNDAYLCTDALSTEKYVSSTYNSSIFEFKDPNIRQTLNHIQKEEQEHGEQIYNYMAQNGMYC